MNVLLTIYVFTHLCYFPCSRMNLMVSNCLNMQATRPQWAFPRRQTPSVKLPVRPTLRSLQTRCHTSQLEINVAKTLILQYNNKKQIFRSSKDGQQVEIVVNFKYLGAALDSQLGFSENTVCF